MTHRWRRYRRAATATRNSPSTAVARHLAAACEGLTAAGLGLGLTEAL